MKIISQYINIAASIEADDSGETFTSSENSYSFNLKPIETFYALRNNPAFDFWKDPKEDIYNKG